MFIDENSPIALYKQIVNQILDAIRSGDLEPGSKLAPERVLAQKLSVNRMTVVKAYDELLAQGVIYKKKGSGTFIDERSRDTLNISAIKWDNYIESNNFLRFQPIITKIIKYQGHIDYIDLSSYSCHADFFKYEDFQKNLDFTHLENFIHDPDNQKKGNKILRSSLVDFMKNHYKVNTNEKNILITSSIKQSLYLIIQCLLNPGDYVAMESSSFLFTLPTLHSLKIRVIQIPMDEFGIIPEELEKNHLIYKIKLLILNPVLQTPTTSSIHTERRLKLLEVIKKYGLAVSEGGSYQLYCNDPNIVPLKSHDNKNSIIFLSSFEKVIPKYIGLSWVVAPENVILKLEKAKSQIDFGVSIFSQMIAYNMIKHDYFAMDFKNSKEEINHNMKKVFERLKLDLSNIIDFNLPEGGYFLWCKLKVKADDREFFNYMLKNKIIISPSIIYGGVSGFFRINISYINDSNIGEIIKVIKNYPTNI